MKKLVAVAVIGSLLASPVGAVVMDPDVSDGQLTASRVASLRRRAMSIISPC